MSPSTSRSAMRTHHLVGLLGRVSAAGILALVPFAAVPAANAQPGGDTLVTVGSPTTPFSQNKQNEPAVAVDAAHPNILAAGANDNIDLEACNSGADNTCPFTPGIGVSGVYFSTDSGATWTQPTYTGLTARGCLGAVGPDAGCTPQVGPIGTLPNYFEAGLASGGDPAVSFGPVPDASGHFSWANGSRLYYANLAAAVPGASPFKGFEVVAVSHTDDIAAAAAGSNAAWSRPVIASKQNAALFSDKEQIWADNAASSPFFGNAYVCYAGFRANPGGGFTPQPLFALTSRDGGDSWTQHQLTTAVNNPVSPQGFGRSGCTVRTDSNGVVYVFAQRFGSGLPGNGGEIMVKSFDGGAHWTRPVTVFATVDTCNAFEPSIGRCVEDGSNALQVSTVAKTVTGRVQWAPPSKDLTMISPPLPGRPDPNRCANTYTTPLESVRTVHPERPKPCGLTGLFTAVVSWCWVQLSPPSREVRANSGCGVNPPPGLARNPA